MKKIIGIDGMSCGHCVSFVTQTLEAMEGVTRVEVSFNDRKAEVEAAESVSDDALRAAVTQAGYTVTGIDAA